MKHTSLLVFFTLLNFNLSAQNKIIPTKKNVNQTKESTTPSKLEIDRLAEKYKDNSSVTLYTSYGELIGNVTIEHNPDNKPQAIKIDGNSTDMKAVDEFIKSIIAQKKQQGYKLENEIQQYRKAEGTFTATDKLYRKGNMYFIVKSSQLEKREIEISRTGEIGGYVNKLSYDFYIETGDNSRKGGKKATKFDF